MFVYDLERGKSTQVTDGLSDVAPRRFDASGKYLYFVASTDAGPASDFSMTTYDHPVTRRLYAIVLRNDLPSPLAPESDEEKRQGGQRGQEQREGGSGRREGRQGGEAGRTA